MRWWKQRPGRRQKLLYEAESSARQNAAVAMKWSALFDKEIPQELLAEIELQRDTCERIIQSKDRLIKEFKTELKAKDDEYVKSLKKQNDDIELLLERMTRQFTSLRKTFDDELEEIETSFMQERAELMHSNQQELLALMQKRLDKEEQYMEARKRRVEEDQRQLEAQQEQLKRLQLQAELSLCSGSHRAEYQQAGQLLAASAGTAASAGGGSLLAASCALLDVAIEPSRIERIATANEVFMLLMPSRKWGDGFGSNRVASRPR